MSSNKNTEEVESEVRLPQPSNNETLAETEPSTSNSDGDNKNLERLTGFPLYNS